MNLSPFQSAIRRSRGMWLVVLVGLLSANVSYAQISSRQVDKLVKNAMDNFTVAGMAVAIVKDGKVIHSKGYGVKSADAKGKVNKHTQFAIASNSKAFTTAALAILIEEGKMSWQDKVVDHIPEFKMYNDYVTENFNIQDLLTHRSGLGLGAGDLMFFPDGADFTIDDVLGVFQYFEPQSAFRTKFDYDNLLYLVAGEIIARVSGESWEDFIKNRIFEPLKMSNSYSVLADIENRGNLALPHSADSGTLTVLDDFHDGINGAAGGIYSSVDDISKWMILQLNHGKYGKNDESALFIEENHREMWKVHTTLNTYRGPRFTSHFAGYGLGWGLTDINGNMVVSHTGGLPGMLSQTLLIPDLNFGIVVLTNTSDDGSYVFRAVVRTVMDSYLGLDEHSWVDTMAVALSNRRSGADSVTTEVWKTVASVNSDHIVDENFIGVYEDNWFGKIEVLMNQGQLWFKSQRSPKLNGPMSYYEGNAFAIKWEYQDMNADALAIFSLDETGRAQKIEMKGISPDIDFSFDFQDLDLNRISD